MADKIKPGDSGDIVNGEAEKAEAERTESTAAATELAQVREQLELKEKEAQANYDRYLRQLAEVENFKKRMAREKEDMIRFANESLLRDMLPVIDNLERAIAHAQGGGNGKPLVEGVEMVLKGLLDVLAKHGLVPISAIGQPFDPAVHEAMAQVESAAHAPNTVIEEHHKGYRLFDRLLRPALVSVAKPPEAKGKKTDGTEVEKPPSND
ncbi:MAG TPA: nucleotide exchange factor GrpE [Candidatus Eisenbacteria bacterium]|nr:nucleotide exchange factor GrpE [Candidatus Eisenbacteria bacterium]